MTCFCLHFSQKKTTISSRSTTKEEKKVTRFNDRTSLLGNRPPVPHAPHPATPPITVSSGSSVCKVGRDAPPLFSPLLTLRWAFKPPLHTILPLQVFSIVAEPCTPRHTRDWWCYTHTDVSYKWSLCTTSQEFRLMFVFMNKHITHCIVHSM